MRFARIGFNILKQSSLIRSGALLANCCRSPKQPAIASRPLHHRHSHPQQTNRPRETRNEPKLPELLYFPHVLRWLKTKLSFKYLQKTWDPEFSEGAFIFGSTHAVCKITDIINRDALQELNSLVTPKVEEQIREELGYKLSTLQKEIIAIHPTDIKLLVPLSVKFDSAGGKKRVKILLKSLSLKWVEYSNSLKLVLVVLETEFQRDYIKYSKSDWIISTFNVIRCSIVTTAPISQ